MDYIKDKDVFSLITLIDKNGQIVASNSNKIIGLDMVNREWYNNVLNNGFYVDKLSLKPEFDILAEEPFGDAYQYSLIIGYSIKNAFDETIGVLAGVVDWNKIQSYLSLYAQKEIEKGLSSYEIFIVDSDKAIVASSQGLSPIGKNILKEIPNINEYLNSEKNSLVNIKVNKKDKIGGTKLFAIENNSWSLFILVNKDEVFAIRKNFAWFFCSAGYY